jgi:transcriptional regulator with XRE-family HTH domain
MTPDDGVLDRLTLKAMLPPPDERKRIRKAAGASRREVAEAVGVDGETVLKWESGVGPGARNLSAYADVLAELRRIAELRESWEQR